MDAGKPVPFHEYSNAVGTDGLWQHLKCNHLKEWVEGCAALNIPLTTDAGKAALQEYNERYGTAARTTFTASMNDDARIPFTKDNFVDALMIWIVADDQVRVVLLQPLFLVALSDCDLFLVLECCRKSLLAQLDFGFTK